MFVPLTARKAAYAPLVFLLAIVATIGITLWAVVSCITGACGAAPPWDCGFARLDARMQDTRGRVWPADSRDIFAAVFRHEA